MVARSGTQRKSQGALGSSHAPPTRRPEAARMSVTAPSPPSSATRGPAPPRPRRSTSSCRCTTSRSCSLSVGTCTDYLSAGFRSSWRITSSTTRSTDDTPASRPRLAARARRRHVLALDRKGRGRRCAPRGRPARARVVAYMDVDLSTDLRALLPLVAPLLSGHSTWPSGPGSPRRPRRAWPGREFISRTYNVILRRRVRGPASATRMRLQGDPPDMRAAAPRRGRRRLVLRHRAAAAGRSTTACVSTRCPSTGSTIPTAASSRPHRGRRPQGRRTGWPPARNSRASTCVGSRSTLAYALLFLLLRGPLGPGRGERARPRVTAVGNTAANRRPHVPAPRPRRPRAPAPLGAVVYVLALGLTTGALAVLHGRSAPPPRALELAVLIAASTVAHRHALRRAAQLGLRPPPRDARPVHALPHPERSLSPP